MVSNKELLNEEIFDYLLHHKVLGKRLVAKVISNLLEIDEELVMSNIRFKNEDLAISDLTIDEIMNKTMKNNVLLVDIRLGYMKDNFVSCLYEVNMSKIGLGKKKSKVIQILIMQDDVLKRDQFIYNVVPMERNLKEEVNSFYEKYYFNLKYLQEIPMNRMKDSLPLEKLLFFLIIDDKRFLEELYKDDVFMRRIVRELYRKALYNNIAPYYSLSCHKFKKLKNDYFVNECINLGFIKEKRAMVKKLYDNGATLDLIRRATELPIEEVKYLIEH